MKNIYSDCAINVNILMLKNLHRIAVESGKTAEFICKSLLKCDWWLFN